ncbi:AraC-like DNA-binding protein [Actinomadura algeriensis]|uniref:AraC-like DNA-binding protein n=1 Tax=Actinomadura algeriensis TaxID=1679523 RepID=A0ABR9JRT1_9ACTN|nr:AraC-like DNA-binding protein [Actinomadura algeriensis]
MARALETAAGIRDRIVAEQAEVQAAERLLAEAVPSMDERPADAGGHRWDGELAARARTLARRAARLADLADRHARAVADYHAARAVFRRPEDGAAVCDETRERHAAGAVPPTSATRAVAREDERPDEADEPGTRGHARATGRARVPDAASSGRGEGDGPRGDRTRPGAGLGPVQAQRLRDIAALRRVRDRIDREYARPLNMQALARGAHMSVGHLSREFRRVYGESPYSYLMTRRIERAMTLLRRGDLSVTEICFAVGYGSLGTFSTRFTELVGVPPGAYRRERSGAGAGIPPCQAKQVTRPVKNQEAHVR